MLETKPVGGGTHDVYWNGKKTHHQLIHVSGGGSRGAARAGVGGYRYFIHNTKTKKSMSFPFSLANAKRELRKKYKLNDPHAVNEEASVRDKASGLPKKYVAGLSPSTARARAAHFAQADKLSDRDPRAYEPAPGDATAKTKPSKHTLAVRKMMKEGSADSSLEAKAKKSGISVSTLKAVYRRGVAAWNSGHRPGTTPQQWGHARVNSYIRKGSGTYHGADKDLREETKWVKDKHGSGYTSSDGKREIIKHPKGWISRSTIDQYDYSDVYPTQREAKAGKYAWAMKNEEVDTTKKNQVKSIKAGAKLNMDPDTKTPDHFTAAMRRKRGLPEDVPANNAGGGNVAGIGVGQQGEPPGKLAVMKKTPLKRFKDFLKKTMK
jgi:hypothetical protein